MFAARLLDAVWPRRCEICGRPSDRSGRHICSECLMGIPFYPLQGCCSLCGRVIAAADRDVMCGECRDGRRPHFERVANAIRFEDDARRIVLDYKFNGHIWLRDDFTDWLEAVANARLSPAAVDLVIPMPITMSHRFDRGFNQCEYLAMALARRLERKCDSSILRRHGRPRRQAGLTREERWVNVKNTFAVKHPERIAGRTILLLDDVMTTGATLSEASRTLVEAGAWRVWAISLARPVAEL